MNQERRDEFYRTLRGETARDRSNAEWSREAELSQFRTG